MPRQPGERSPSRDSGRRQASELRRGLLTREGPTSAPRRPRLEAGESQFTAHDVSVGTEEEPGQDVRPGSIWERQGNVLAVGGPNCGRPIGTDRPERSS